MNEPEIKKQINYRSVSVDTCWNCKHNNYIWMTDEITCLKYDFYTSKLYVCDDWEKKE